MRKFGDDAEGKHNDSAGWAQAARRLMRTHSPNLSLRAKRGNLVPGGAATQSARLPRRYAPRNDNGNFGKALRRCIGRAGNRH